MKYRTAPHPRKVFRKKKHGFALIATLTLLTSFDHLDQRLILASRDLGATPAQTLKNVIFPMVRPGLLSVLFIIK